MFGTLAGGLCVTLFLGVCGSWLLTLQEQWCIYASLSWHMVLLSLVNVTTIMNSCFCTFEMAQGRFRFLWYLLPFILLKSVGMYVITGYTFFEGMLPDGCMQAMSEFNPNRLVVVLSSFLGVNIATTLFIVVDLIVRWKRRNSVKEKGNA